eukprot:scaffold45756_cov206-Amphora_coffeaeformis.AAC.2
MAGAKHAKSKKQTAAPAWPFQASRKSERNQDDRARKSLFRPTPNGSHGGNSEEDEEVPSFPCRGWGEAVEAWSEEDHCEGVVVFFV